MHNRTTTISRRARRRWRGQARPGFAARSRGRGFAARSRGPGYGAFLRAIRHQPGFWLKLMAAAGFATAFAMRHSAIAVAEVLGGTLLACATVGYLIWRAFGP
jgi:hypothetical protein